MNNITHSKDTDGSAYIHMRGLGDFKVPDSVQAGLNTATNEWLFENVKRGGFVDPFVLAEISNRKIYGAYLEWKQAKLPPPRTMADWFNDAAASVDI